MWIHSHMCLCLTLWKKEEEAGGGGGGEGGANDWNHLGDAVAHAPMVEHFKAFITAKQ